MLSRLFATVAAAAVVAVAAPLPAAAAAPIALPPQTGGFDYQLGGPSDLPGLSVVARDSTAAPLRGAYNICYLNGFQTQPDEGRQWLARYGEAVLRDGAGKPVADPDWPDEYLLDPSTAPRRALILSVLGPRIDRCADAGFDAVEIDNLDTFTRDGRVARAAALELAHAYVQLAHDRGLAAGQKNAAEITGVGHDEVGFDFAVAEECAAYDECTDYARVYGGQVLQIEYTDNLPEPFAAVCASPGRAALTILRDRALTPAGAPGHVRRQCG